MPIFTLNISEASMPTIRRLARELDCQEVDALKLIVTEGLRRARAVQDEEDAATCPLDRCRSRMDALVGEEVAA